MKIILDSVQPVIKNSKYVRINRQAINDFSKTVTEKDLEGSEYNNETVLKHASEEEHIAYSSVYNSLNFCYWGEPKWTITINKNNYDGSFAMLRALKRAIKEGYQILNPKYLSDIPEKDLEKIFRGNVEIPLFQERLELLRQLGKITTTKFSGSFTNVIKKSKGNATKIVKVLAKDFPAIFNDVANFQGKEVKFYKRAQLVPAHLFDLKKLGLLSIPITGYEELTAFADYKVPQLLRKFGILVYSDKLAKKIDNKIEIKAGSIEEIEIRANTIWAIELATREIKNKFPQATAAKIDGIFWFRGQIKSPDDKPYHRTKTIWY